MSTLAKDGQLPRNNTDRAQYIARKRRYEVLAWAVLLITIAVSLWAAFWAWQQRKDAAAAQFAARSNLATAALSTYINASEDTLLAAAAMLESQPEIDHPHFLAFAEKLRLGSDRLGIRGIGFARIVDDEQRERYLSQQRRIYGQSFDIYPSGRRDAYTVIDLIYPESSGLKLLLGKDVANEASRRDAMQRAGTSGTTTMALSVALSDRARGDSDDTGFIMYAPVYDSLISDTGNVSARRPQLRGYTTAGFGWSEVLNEVLGEDAISQFDLELRQQAAADQPPAFATHRVRDKYGHGMHPAFSTAYPIRVLGEQWQLRFESPPASRVIPGLPFIIVQTLCGMGLGGLLFLQLRQTARRDQHNRALLNAAADRLPILIAYLNSDRRYGFANRATAEWFSADKTWRGRTLEGAHAEDPALLETIDAATRRPQHNESHSWEAEIGQPPRSVQMHLVPELRSDHSVVGWYLLGNDTSEQMRSRRHLLQANEQLQRITDKLPAYIAQFDQEQRVVFRNQACFEATIWQRPCDVGVSLRELLTDEEYLERKPHADAALAGQEVEFTTVLHRGQPHQRRMHTYYTPITDKAGQVTGFLAMKTDVTEFDRLRDELFDARARAEVTLTSISEAVFVTDVEGRITYMNPAAELLSGWPLTEAREQLAEQIAPLQAVHSDVLDGESAAGNEDIELVRRDGQHIFVESSRSQLHDSEKQLIGHVMVLRDVTEAHALSARMSYLAHHDPLTGLPNRLQLNEMLGQIVSSASRRGNGLAVLFIDLDLFKHVNDALGHHIGDLLLQQVARRLQRCVGDVGSVYRTGGDEFVVLLHHVITRADVDVIAERLLHIHSTPYHVGSHELHQTFSIGISLFPDDGYDSATLMMRADAAMYLAKRSGRNASHFYTEELAASVDARLELESSLRRSLRDGELQLFYQPRIDLRSGRIIGVEALLRWPRGDRILLPGEFLPVAEETSLIVEIDQWALRAACRQNRAWQLAGLSPIRVSVNVAAANFDNDRLLTTVNQALEESGLSPEHLELELTETTLIRDTVRTERVLSALKASGVHIAIDDFGTGFSNLGYLGKYGFDVLKIDRSFTSGIVSANSQGAITRVIIGLAEQLQCRTVAEGVETVEQAQWLALNGCDELQGYLFSQPLPAADFARLLASHPQWQVDNGWMRTDTTLAKPSKRHR